ncbi:YlmC/YmxH family sporulation protein [Halobacillus fulvus]|nr:YlmC/YmxH family sporulation protein [Halobacillus fulvus]
MRLTSLSNKEVIDIDRGQKLGILGRADLTFDPQTGDILTLIVLNHRFGSTKEMMIDWGQISTIGKETILIKSPE